MEKYKKCHNTTSIEPERYGAGEIPEESWPAKGELEFKNVTLSYREDTETVLNDLSFKVEPGHKIGVVGRTGAGKSTICNALTRIIDDKKG